MNLRQIEKRIDELDELMLAEPKTSFGLAIERALLNVRWCTLHKREDPDNDKWHKREADATRVYHKIQSDEWIANLSRWYSIRADRKKVLAEMDEVLGSKPDATVVDAEPRFDGGRSAPHSLGPG